MVVARHHRVPPGTGRTPTQQEFGFETAWASHSMLPCCGISSALRHAGSLAWEGTRYLPHDTSLGVKGMKFQPDSVSIAEQRLETKLSGTRSPLKYRGSLDITPPKLWERNFLWSLWVEGEPHQSTFDNQTYFLPHKNSVFCGLFLDARGKKFDLGCCKSIKCYMT